MSEHEDVIVEGRETLINDRQLAKRWNIHEATPSNWRSRGVGPKFVRLAKQTIRYRLPDVEEYEESSVRTSTVRNDDHADV